MFVVVLVVCFTLGLLGLGYADGALQVVLLAGAGAAGGVLALVVHRWLTSPAAVKDFFQGGVAWLRDGPQHLRWGDWEIALTREGSVDKRSGRLELRRRALCGLIPLETIERPVSAFYRVELETVQRTDGDGQVVGVIHRLNLVDRTAGRLEVLDLATGLDHGDGDALVQQLRAALEEAVGSAPRG